LIFYYKDYNISLNYEWLFKIILVMYIIIKPFDFQSLIE